MPLYVHLSIGVQWNPRLHYDSLPVYLVYPYESKSQARMAMLSKQDHGRSREAGSTHEIQDCDPYWLQWLVIKLIRTLI
jgi:hypothetical protein